MNPAMWVAKTGLDAQQHRISVISNNLANVNTTGFKRSRAVFEDLIYQTVKFCSADRSIHLAVAGLVRHFHRHCASS